MSISPRWRMHHLDALRGLAVIQILSSTFLAAFYPNTLPDLTRADGSFPAIVLAAVTDGYAGICLFFVASGYALTFAYADLGVPVLRLLAARLVRLAVPALAAIGLGGLLATLVPLLARDGLRVTGSALLNGVLLTPAAVSAVIADVAGAIVGYNGSSAVADLISAHSRFVFPIRASLNPALWCCCQQVAGSIVVIFLIGARDISRVAWLCLLGAVALITLGTPLGGMLIGHALARSPLVRSPRLPMGYALIPMWFGFRLCLYPQPEIADTIAGVTTHLPFLPFAIAPNPALASKAIGAALLFSAVALAPWPQQVLPRLGLAVLGRASLSLYLVHVPVIIGVGAVLSKWSGRSALGGSPLGTVGLTLLATCLTAAAFSIIDRFALAAGRWIMLGETDDPPLAQTAMRAPVP